MSDEIKPAFEESIVELEKILRSLEDGTTTLEESLGKYERGVYLIKTCFGQLASAEERITQLMAIDESGKPQIKPFAHSNSAESMTTEPKRRARKSE